MHAEKAVSNDRDTVSSAAIAIQAHQPATANRLVSGRVKLLAAAIAIQAHRPRHAQSGKLHSEKGVNIDRNEAVARVAFCTIF